MLVSIIVATYKRDKSLKRALDSLLKQTYKNIEIIVIDDNANESWNTKVFNIIESLNSKKIKYIKNLKNLGSAKTRNIGIEASTGQYITFLDDDDIYLEKKVENQLEEMLKQNADFSVTDLELYTDSDIFIEKRKREYIRSYDSKELLKNHLMHHITGTDTMMFKKNYLLKIGMFEPIDVGDEFYLMQKAIEYGGIFIYVKKSDIKAYVHIDENSLSCGDSKIVGENMLYEYKKRYFYLLDKKSIRYIKMRHYAVLAFTNIKMKNGRGFLKNSVKAVLYSPIGCFNLIKNSR